jgi:hypothetical protein
MLLFKNGQIPEYNFLKAVKRPIPIRCIQMHEPFVVETKEGVLKGNAGDYLMVGVKGEMYPCSKEIFEETYELVSSGTS